MKCLKFIRFLFLILIIFVSFFSFPQTVKADNPLSLKKVHLILVKEEFSTGQLIRYYESKDKKLTPAMYFNLPYEAIPIVDASSDPVLEAKKQLLFYYTLNDSKLRLKELKNEYFHYYPNATFSLSPSLTFKFQSDATSMEENLKKRMFDFQNLTKEEQDKLKNVPLAIVSDFSLLPDKLQLSSKESVSKNSSMDTNIEVKNSKDWVSKIKNGSFSTFFVVFFFFLFIVSITLYVLKRR